VDIKGKGIVDLVTLVHFARQGRRLKRDLILLAVADEEAGSAGTRWLVQQHPELVRGAALLLDEGGGVRVDGRRVAYLVSIAEKAPLWLRLTARGTAAHASVPLPDSAVQRLVLAAARIAVHRRPARVLPEFKAQLLQLLAGRELGRFPGFTGEIGTSLAAADFVEAITRADPEINALLRDTVSITQLVGGGSINSIPNEAALGLDCRLLPGTDRARFIEELRRVARDPALQIRVVESLPAASSPAGGPLFDALARVARRRHRGAPVVPVLLLSSTDSPYYRQLGIQAYGFEPYPLSAEEAARAHGNDERLPVASLLEGIAIQIDLLEELDR